MIAPRGLGRQVAISMIFVAMTTLLLTFASFYLAYWFLVHYAPQLIPAQDQMLPNGTDFLIFALLCLMGLGVALTVALRLARRVMAPLSAVVQAARRVANGDLTARAAQGDRSIGELALLVDDFNTMAARLEKMASDAVSWNAQIAHELRTPLTILRGRLQGLSDGVFIADAAVLRGLMTQVEGLSRLVDDLRVVSLVDTGHIVLDLAQIDLAREIADLALLMGPRLERAGFTLALDLAPGSACVDGMRVRQALTALLENARQHADPGTVRITLRLTPNDVTIGVIDQGPGLPPGFEARAFDLFSQPGPVQAGRGVRPRQGTGLGLSVVRAIADAHRGSIRYRATAQGAAFLLTLPRAPMPEGGAA